MTPFPRAASFAPLAGFETKLQFRLEGPRLREPAHDPEEQFGGEPARPRRRRTYFWCFLPLGPTTQLGGLCGPAVTPDLPEWAILL